MADVVSAFTECIAQKPQCKNEEHTLEIISFSNT